MVRKVTFIVRPAPTLGALLTFAQATRTHRSGLGERLEREVRLALETAARTLDPLLVPLRWLARRGHSRTSGYVDATGLSTETTVTFDLRAAVTAALEQGPRIDGRDYTDLYSLRSLIRTLRKAELLSFDGVLLGRQSDTPRALLRVVEAACRETALCDELMVPKVFIGIMPVTPDRPKAPKVPKPALKNARGTVGASPEPTSAEPKKSEGPTAHTAPSGASMGGSFGGLPDDATSPPTTPETPLSSRGLSLDAEFFLESARLKVWPCSPTVLSRARRTVLIALHPDRAGEGTEVLFRSALKGFEDLSEALSALPPPSRDSKSVQAAVSSDVRSPAIGQWPPPPIAAAPTETPAGAAQRQSFKSSSKA